MRLPRPDFISSNMCKAWDLPPRRDEIGNMYDCVLWMDADRGWFIVERRERATSPEEAAELLAPRLDAEGGECRRPGVF